MTSLSRRQLFATLGTVAGGLSTLAGCLTGLRESSTQPSTETPTPPPSPTRSPTDTPTTTPTDTPTATPTDTPTASPTDTPTDSPSSLSVSTPSSSIIPFEPLRTFTSDEYGYQISIPEPWIIEDSEGGNSIKLTDTNDLAFLKVVVDKRQSWLSLSDYLPVSATDTTYEQTQMIREGQPALRFEKSYRNSNGTERHVEGLITHTKSHVFTAQCGVTVRSFDNSHGTPTPVPDDGPPLAVDWTPAIKQATTGIINSFTLGKEKSGKSEKGGDLKILEHDLHLYEHSSAVRGVISNNTGSTLDYVMVVVKLYINENTTIASGKTKMTNVADGQKQRFKVGMIGLNKVIHYTIEVYDSESHYSFVKGTP
jgi:hypothetical protein